MFINQFVAAVKTSSGRKYAVVNDTREEAIEAIKRAERIHGSGCAELMPLVESDYKKPQQRGLVVVNNPTFAQKAKYVGIGVGIGVGIAVGVGAYRLHKKWKESKREAEEALNNNSEKEA